MSGIGHIVDTALPTVNDLSTCDWPDTDAKMLETAKLSTTKGDAICKADTAGKPPAGEDADAAKVGAATSCDPVGFTGKDWTTVVAKPDAVGDLKGTNSPKQRRTKAGPSAVLIVSLAEAIAAVQSALALPSERPSCPTAKPTCTPGAKCDGAQTGPAGPKARARRSQMPWERLFTAPRLGAVPARSDEDVFLPPPPPHGTLAAAPESLSRNTFAPKASIQADPLAALAVLETALRGDPHAHADVEPPAVLLRAQAERLARAAGSSLSSSPAPKAAAAHQAIPVPQAVTRPPAPCGPALAVHLPEPTDGAHAFAPKGVALRPTEPDAQGLPPPAPWAYAAREPEPASDLPPPPPWARREPAPSNSATSPAPMPVVEPTPISGRPVRRRRPHIAAGYQLPFNG